MQADERTSSPAEESPDDETPRQQGRLGAALRGVMANLRGILGRLRHRPAPAAEADDEAPAPRRWRSRAAYAALLLAGISAGGGGTYFFFSGLVAKQSAEIGRKQETIEKQDALLAGYEKILVIDHRKLEEEQAKLQGQEKALDHDARTLKERKAGLEEAERRLAQLRQERANGDPRPSQPPPAGNRSPQADAARAGSCDLRAGNVGATLKNCIEEFNRM